MLPFGDFIKNNAFIAHDIYREHKPKLAVGFAASYNVKASSAIGTDNAQITGIYNKSGVADYANYTKVVADFIFKQNGICIFFFSELGYCSIRKKKGILPYRPRQWS